MSKKLTRKNKIILKFFFTALLLLIITLGITASLLDRKNNYVLSLKQVEHSLVSVSPDSIDPKNNLKPVYLTGFIDTADHISDERLGVSAKALLLHRKVYMYQWREKVDAAQENQQNNEKDDSFSYEKVWSDHLNDSSKFHMQHGHINPVKMPLDSEKMYSQKATVGDFIITDITIGSIKSNDKIDLSNIDIKALQEKLNTQLSFVSVDDMVCSGSVEKPQIGDICIELYAAKPQIVSIIAQQDENKLQPYLARAGERVFILESGQQSARELLNSKMSSYRKENWISYVKRILRSDTGF